MSKQRRNTSIEPANLAETYISYYTWGEAIAIGLDLTLRERSGGRITLDHYMRALWEKFGRSAAQTPGYVPTPYTLADLKNVLADVSGDAAFATQFFASYIEGRNVAEYTRLLSRAGLLVRSRTGSAAFDVVPAEDAGDALTDDQRRFRDAWLSSPARNAF